MIDGGLMVPVVVLDKLERSTKKKLVRSLRPKPHDGRVMPIDTPSLSAM